MRNVILQEFVSLDGLAAGANDSTDFVPASTRGDQGFGREQVALMDAVDTMLLGRKTYELFAGYWPKVTEGDEKPFADKINAMHKIVFSRTLQRAPWGSRGDARIVRSNPADEVTTLKRQPGKDMIVWGSLSIARELMAAGLIDQYRLVMCPVVLGAGKALFPQQAPSTRMTLQGAKAFDLGAVRLQYVPV